MRSSIVRDSLPALETQAAVTDDLLTDESTLPQNFGPEPEQVARFIEHWAASGGVERANFPSFAHNLCDLLAAPHPEPTKTDVAENAYVFERDVTFQNLDGSTSIGRIDLYKRSCFVLEARQGQRTGRSRRLGRTETLSRAKKEDQTRDRHSRDEGLG